MPNDLTQHKQSPKNQLTEKFILTLTVAQAEAVMNACELYARLHIGQFERITERMLRTDSKDYEIRCITANDLLHTVAKLILGTGSTGLCNVNRTDESERAWDVFQSVRNAVEEYKFPSGMFTMPRTQPCSMIGEAIPSCKVDRGECEE